MLRMNWKTVSTLVAVGVLAGCQESAVLAPEAVSVAPTTMMNAPADRPSLSLSGIGLDNGSTSFTVGPAGGVYFVGDHAVVFPARSICDPAVSNYGPGTWDQPCTPLSSPLRVSAEVRVADGRTWVDFTPALRFVPAASPAKWVWLFMYTPSAMDDEGDLSPFNILYAPSIGGTLLDESLTDSTLRTYVDTRTGVSLRRIKHFSGYTSSG